MNYTKLNLILDLILDEVVKRPHRKRLLTGYSALPNRRIIKRKYIQSKSLICKRCASLIKPSISKTLIFVRVVRCNFERCSGCSKHLQYIVPSNVSSDEFNNHLISIENSYHESLSIENYKVIEVLRVLKICINDIDVAYKYNGASINHWIESRVILLSTVLGRLSKLVYPEFPWELI